MRISRIIGADVLDESEFYSGEKDFFEFVVEMKLRKLKEAPLTSKGI